MSKSSSNDNPKKLMNELGDLVDFLADGPELQGELGLPNHQDVPVLTAKVGEPIEDMAEANLNALVDDLVNLVMPRLEIELRSRLKKKISDLSD